MRLSLLIVLLLALPLAFAQPYHLPLLAVQDFNGTLIGSTADLYLEVRSGTGRVFLETYPLTKIDTQISTRFAKDVACNQYELNCDSHDFIYTIRSDSNIIGGPSAGAAISVLTASALLNLDVNDSTAITGTINSGGLIGPVGGVKEKIEAANRNGITTVLVPKSRNVTVNNVSVNLSVYAKSLNVTVFEVTDLTSALQIFTGKSLGGKDLEVENSLRYDTIMQNIAFELCNRSKQLEIEAQDYKANRSLVQTVLNTSLLYEKALYNKNYYSAASFCFGLNIDLREHLYFSQNFTSVKVNSKAGQLQTDLLRFERWVESREIESINDLQAYTIVRERLFDTRDYLDRSLEPNASLRDLAYAKERFYSAKVWSKFFAFGGDDYTVNEQLLRSSCIGKLQEARERAQYAQLFVGKSFNFGIPRAQQMLEDNEYELCLIYASESKGHANTVLSSVGNTLSGDLVDNKISALRKVIAKTQAKGIFPILGYSYYEYANSLKDHDSASALLYSEYALELSNLDLYFPKKNNNTAPVKRTIDNSWLLFALGFLCGASFLGALLTVRKLIKPPETP